MAKKSFKLVKASAALAVTAAALTPVMAAEASTSTVELKSEVVLGGKFKEALALNTPKGVTITWGKYLVTAINKWQTVTGKGSDGKTYSKKLYARNYPLYILDQDLGEVEAGSELEKPSIRVMYRDGKIYTQAAERFSMSSNYNTKDEGEQKVLISYNHNGNRITSFLTYTVVKSETEIEELKAVSSKALEVKFNNAVDTAKAQFEVKKNGVKINTSAIAFDATKKVATIELSSKISEGEYTVTVTGVEDEAISKSVKAQDERVAKIEVLSTEVPLVDLDALQGADDLAVPYKVENQYGEDITKVTSLVSSSGTVDAANGLVKFVGDYNTTTNKTVAFTLINVATQVSTSAVVTATAASVASDVQVVGVYNKDGKLLTETTELAKDAFFLETVVKDQYGKVIANPVAANLILTESNNTVVNAEDSAGTPVLDTTTVPGKVLVKLEGPLKVGSNVVSLIVKNTGKSSSYTVNVAESTRVANITLGQPGLVASGEDAFIPVTAVDKSGNAVKDLDLITDGVRGVASTSGTFVKKDGEIFLKVTAPAQGPNIAIATVRDNQKLVSVNYTVSAAAYPAVITGLDKDIQTSINTGLSQAVRAQDLVIEDQYGRVMSDSAVNTWVNLPNNALVVTSSKETTDNSPFTVGAVDASTQILAAAADSLAVTAKAVADGQVATEKLTFSISTDAGTTVIPSTSKEVVFTRVALSEFVNFEVVAPSTIFNDTTSTYGFKVYGVKASGAKVLLEESNYNAILPAGFLLNGNNENTLSLTAAVTGIDADAGTPAPLTKDFNIRIVLADTNATTLVKTVTVSAEPRKVVELKASSTGDSTSAELNQLSFELANVTDGLDLADLETNLYIVDQYGKEAADISGTPKVTFSNVMNVSGGAAPTIAANGESIAAVSGLEVGDTVKAKVEIDGVVKVYDVKVTANN